MSSSGSDGQECHEEVSRRGQLQPCDKTAVALRVDPTFGTEYPVCAFHARADMVPLTVVVARERAAAWQAGHGDPECDVWVVEGMCAQYHPNPYRAKSVETGDNDE